VDFLRTPVTDFIRPFRDSDTIVKRRWYPCEPGAPILPFPTAFFSAHWEPFPWLPRDVGQVYPPVTKCLKKRVIWGFNFQHFCGTAEQFARGAEFDPDFVQPIGPDWIPLCCNRQADAAEGGLEFGGAVGDVFTTTDAAEGGLELGGEAGDEFRPPDAAEGGLELGGEAGDEFRPPDAAEGGLELGGEAGDVYEGPVECPPLVATCEDAEPGFPDHQCVYGPGLGALPYWRKWSPGSGVDVAVHLGIVSPNPLSWSVWEGEDCSSLSLVDAGVWFSGGGIVVPFTTTAEHVWLALGVTFGGVPTQLFLELELT